MNASRTFVRIFAVLATVAGLLGGGAAFAQVTPAAGYTPPDDTPAIKVGVTIFTDYTYQDVPLVTDSDGNLVHQDGFDVKRSYINVTGNINHLIAFRITPDIQRITSTNLNGSLTFRLKYAYGQYNLDEKWTKGSWVRFGAQQTPYVDWLENVYRYRFQGTILTDREGFLSSSDFGLSTHYNLPGNYGDLHVGYYNGDTYSKAEVGDQKAFQARLSFRPLPGAGVLKGLRLTAFYDADHFAQRDEKRRFVATGTFEHKHLVAGYEHFEATDVTTAVSNEVRTHAWSAWATPRIAKGWEGLLRYDHLSSNDPLKDGSHNRKIGGIAYWIQGQQPSTTAAFLVDYEAVNYDQTPFQANERRIALHTLFNF